ncbi:FKBP-type peptidyl-prolyl cis-trans isomerase [Tsukamurella strandjordii]|uniref:FKBP-type peptidyl-prolyl cis-trans isomerase n=1 Tax=Tsukamurella TaxID=2060 RepID=UPI001C7E014C|nr:FKBP-type peptidyl-prolyl cis-trans isomerase [Tsukamurella sp. TY48]GIZ95734.1 peptidyl-prolyl cis-trans isomerase [Tsukamurella sp. TY48]
MHASRLLTTVTVATLAAATLTACGSGPKSEATCPSGSPGTSTAPDWRYQGAKGSLEVTGPTDANAPRITVTTPFEVAQTHVQTFAPRGDGAEVSEKSTVSVCYMGVNGRDGKVFDSSYDRGTPAEFSLDGVIPGFKKALEGQKVGSTVGVAVAPADGYPEGQPAAGIQAGDTLVFVLKILSAK